MKERIGEGGTVRLQKAAGTPNRIWLGVGLIRVEIMTTCRCCGQVVLPGEAVGPVRRVEVRAETMRSSAGAERGQAEERSGQPARRVAINVDEALLVLCNTAFRYAEEQASETVEIAHLVCCLVSAPLPDYDFHREGIDRQRLSEAARSWLHGAGRAPDGRRPRTSEHLKVLLSRAEAVATQETRRFAGPFDFIRVLAHQSDDLASARFVVEATERRARPGEVTQPPAQEARQEERSGMRRVAAGERGPRPSQLQFRFERRYRPDVDTLERTERQDKEGAWSSLDVPEPPERHEQQRSASGEMRGLDRVPVDRHGNGYAHGLGREAGSGVAGRSFEHSKGQLVERLHRQEALVADLVGLMSRMIDPRADAAGLREVERRGRQGGENDGGSTAGTSSGPAGGESLRGRSSQGGNRLRFKRRRTLVAGLGIRSSSSSGDGEGSRRGQEGMLRVVSRNEPAVDRRLGALREQAPEIDDAMGARADLEADDDGYAQGDGLGDRMKRFYLSPDDDIVKAPSIGPKTAARLTPAGLVLVRDLLACDPEDVVARTANRYITVGRIADWMAQARLVCTIPWLRGTHAQLLVGAGYDTLTKLSRADASSVCSAILRFSATREGQSILRSGPPPEIDRIACWIENTALAEPARAA